MSDDLQIFPGDDYDDENQKYILRLFVAGASINSLRAVNNLKELCETHLYSRYSLEIIDVHQQKDIAEKENIIALPLLIKTFPLPERRMVGDMSDTPRVLKGLGLSN